MTGGPDPEDGTEPDELMAGFRAAPGGATARFARAQAAIIRDLVGQIAELVGGDATAEPAGEPGEVGEGRPPGDSTGPRAPDGPDTPDDLAALLGLSDSSKPPDDPVLARLLPDGYTEDPEAAAEFRRYTEQELRSGKVAAARTVLATLPPSGGRVRLSGPEAQAWLRALNDVRLALGVVLGVTDDFEEQIGQIQADDPRSAYIWVYQWLAELQESLVDALS